LTTKNKPQLVLRSVRGRIDYNINNYCATCGYKLPKEIMWCPDCKQRVRTRPWHRAKATDAKRI
jgi:lipopolysaccharide biosynthesis regulator YciM